MSEIEPRLLDRLASSIVTVPTELPTFSMNLVCDMHYEFSNRQVLPTR